jgi:uncharacterized membrane protein YdbT with pleckstrin-like domain
VRENLVLPDITIQPTKKFLRIGTIAVAIVVIALEILIAATQGGLSLLMIAPPLLLLWPAMHALQRKFTRTVISGDRLRCETGMASKSTRTIQLSKLQDVKVDQRLSQRMFDVGDLSIETAGEASRLTIQNVDNPQALADEILNRAQHGAGV